MGAPVLHGISNSLKSREFGTPETMKSVKIKESLSKINAILVLKDGNLEGGADYLRSDSYAEGF